VTQTKQPPANPARFTWRKSIQAWHGELCDVYVYFDNDQKSAAPMDALALLRLLAH
jgi:uncharacterized protein YecE (DUF72 family)